MHWHWPHWSDFLAIIHHLPPGVEHLIAHEDKALLAAAMHGFLPQSPTAATTPPPSHLPPIVDAPDSSGTVMLEKEIDLRISRSQQNMGLLIHDYLHTLPVYHASTPHAEQLLEHWRTLLLEQPERIAQAKSTHWVDDKTKAFWHARLSDTPAYKAAQVEAWQHMSAAPLPHPATRSAMHEKQWQEMVIRNRLHQMALQAQR